MGGPMLPRSAIYRPTPDILKHDREQRKQSEKGEVSLRLEQTTG